MNLEFTMLKPSITNNELNQDTVYDLLILGGGPGALNAALYAGRKNLNVGIITNDIGGQLLNTSYVDNYLGIKTTSGEEVARLFSKQIDEFNIPIIKDIYVTNILKDNNLFKISTSNNHTYLSKAVILALGSTPRKLNIIGEDKYIDKGISYCAICDGPLYKNKTVIVLGGGNSAVEAAIDLSRIANKVIVVHRSKFRADSILVDKMKSTNNIEIYLETQVLEIVGDTVFKSIIVMNSDSSINKIDASGLFIEIGNIPNTSLMSELTNLNEYKEVIVDSNQQTNIDGLFAVGDMTNTKFKQIIIAAADGAKAALAANEYLNTLKEK